MRVIGRTLAGAVLLEVDQQEADVLVRLAEALVDCSPVAAVSSPSPQAPQPLAAAPVPDSASATIRRKRVPRATGKTFAFPGGPAVKVAAGKPATGVKRSSVTTKERPCEQCKMPYVPTGNAQKICPACKAARLEEIRRLAREQEE